MPISNRSGFLRCSRIVSVTSRTAVYGPVRTVVWQGSAGDCRPYADQCAIGVPTTDDETGCERGYGGIVRGRDQRPVLFWSLVPVCECGPDAEQCALAQQIVAFRREVKEHVKESQFLTSVLRSRRKETQCDSNISPLCWHGCASEVHISLRSPSCGAR